MATRNKTARKIRGATAAAGDEGASQDAIERQTRFLESELANEVINTLRFNSGLTKNPLGNRALSTILTLQRMEPQDEVERLLTAQMLAAHSAAMECMTQAMIPDQTLERRELHLKHAEKLLAIYTRQVEALDKHRGKGQQKVTVEYVNVEAGGQAMVGNVEAGAGRPPTKRGTARAPKSIAHEPELPVEVPAAEGLAVVKDEDAA